LEDGGRGLFITKNPPVPFRKLTNVRKHVVRKLYSEQIISR
jgi:hypothetical protein